MVKTKPRITKNRINGKKDWCDYYKEDRSLYDGGDELPFDRLPYLTYEQSSRLWTMVDGDGELPVVIAGYHVVNRMAYWMSKEPWTSTAECYSAARFG